MGGIGDSIPHGRVRRTMPLAGFTARAAGGRVVAGLREKTGDAGAVERFHERTAERYCELLGHSKGVLMKAGQLLSLVDVGAIGYGGFSPYHQALSRLQADAPPMDPALAKEVLQADLGRPAAQVFAEFADEPMAAASIGQVHRAVLHDGRRVVVKIQYPGAARAIREDLANAELLATFFRFAAAASGTAMQPDLPRAAKAISARIAEEVDYRHEAANITAFAELYRGHPFIRVPEVIGEACGDRVLTMTYLDGITWDKAQHASQDLKNSWAEVIFRFVVGSFRHSNLFHADPHPGNYCFGADGTVGFVDFGCVTVMPELLRRRQVGIVRALVDRQPHRLRNLMVEAGYFAADSALSADELYPFFAGLLCEMLAPQPVTYTPDIPRRAIRAIDLRAPEHPVRQMSVPDDLVLLSRINLAMNAVLATLRATFDVRSVVDDMDGIAEPTTSLGTQHHAWVRQRGLPYGMQPHDQP